MGEGLARVLVTLRQDVALTRRLAAPHLPEYLREPFHQLRWSPFPKGKDLSTLP